MTDVKYQVLVVDDEYLISSLLTAYVEEMGLEVCAVAATADDATRLAQEHRPAVVLMDVRLQGKKDGVDAAMVIHETVGSKVIFITGSSEPSTIDRIRLDHPASVLFKPVTEHQVQQAITAALA